jgi:predicted acylesterase/phospholipase RssA
MEMRFAPVTVALPDTDRPQAGVVVKGSLGAAVRTSGALPPSFAPTIKNWVRYADGGAGTAVPARVTRDFGADVTMAVNAIPGPQRGNQYGGLPGGWLLHQMPILGRMLDSYTWYAFFWEQTSAEFGREAEVFVDFEPQWFPMLESSAFVFAQWIADAAAKQTRTQGSASPPAKIVEALKKKWQELGG